MARFSGIAVLIGLLVLDVRAAAQETSWIVVIAAAGRDDTSRAAAAAESEANRLRDRGETVLGDADVAARLRERLSVPFEPASDQTRNRFIAAVEPALLDVAGGDRRSTLDRVDPLLREAEASSAALARDDETARAISNLCMLGVRASLDSRLAQDAAERARGCVKLVPDIAPESLTYQGEMPMHPEPVRALVDAARARLATEGTEVRVEATGDARSCTLRVSGRPLTTSLPATVRLFRGTHALQVECDRTTADLYFQATGCAPL